MIPLNLNKSESLRHMVGQMILGGFQGKIVSKKCEVYDWIRSDNIGGVLLYDLEMTQFPPGKRNIESPEQVKQLTRDLQNIADTPLFIAVDQEGGIVNRLTPEYGFPEFLSWHEIGKLNDIEKTRAFSLLVANTLQKCGINLNLAPVLDIQKDNDTIIGKEGRCISNDPEQILKHSRIFIEEHRKKQIATSGKHFPGQGSAIQDAHDELTDISDSWQEPELSPYEELIRSDHLKMIMTGHVLIRSLDENYPATLSKKIIGGLLRKKMGFNGVVISDDPVMKSISDHYSWEETLELMINAGIDIICLGNNLIPYRENLIPDSIETIISLVDKGKISSDRIEESYRRIINLKSMIA